MEKDNVTSVKTQDSTSKCLTWLQSTEFTSTDDDTVSESERSTAFASSTEESDLISLSDNVDNINITNIESKNELKILSNNTTVADINHTEILQNVFHGNNTQTFGNIQIKHGKNIHFGNVTYVTGPIHIVHTAGDNYGTQQMTASSTTPAPPHPKVNENSHTNDTSSTNKVPPEEDEAENSKNRDNMFIKNNIPNIDSSVLRIVNRRTWLAQPALESEEMETPVEYVIISHTATEPAATQAEMVYMVRMIQCFHIESRNWSDISYSFLIGNDGNVYEGRGWNRVGAHTMGYNKRSIGISFVGCFMNVMPAQIALDACKLLIHKGIKEGKITENYKLLAHCQCSTTESPGKLLFEEIKTWDHWSQEP